MGAAAETTLMLMVICNPLAKFIIIIWECDLMFQMLNMGVKIALNKNAFLMTPKIKMINSPMQWPS